MLEARIQQLQSDALDIQHAKVQFLKTPSSGRGVPSSRGPKSTAREKMDIPKLGQPVGKGVSKSQPSRWMEKLTQEKNNKIKKEQHFQQNIQKNVKERPISKTKSSKSSPMLPRTAHKIISTAPSNKKSRGNMKLSDEIRAAVSSSVTSTAAAVAAGSAAKPKKVSQRKGKDYNNQFASGECLKRTDTDAQARGKELAEVEELERRLNQQVSLWTSSANPERLQEDSEGGGNGDIQLSIRSFLEACVFAGDIDRAHCFLLSQHRVMSRRRHLNTGIYNIMMRVWAKKVRFKDT